MLWVLDLDGVVWLAGRPIPGSVEAIADLQAGGHRVAFVTNNATPTVEEYLERFAGMGITTTSDSLVTSAQAAASLVLPGNRVTMLGGPGLRQALLDREVELVPAGARPEAVVAGRSLTLDFDELAGVCTAIRAGARFIATNTDATFPTPRGLEPGAGALIAYLQTGSGRAPEVAGKPHPAIAGLLRDRLGPPAIVVGDRLDTDGAFAAALAAPFGLVLSGVTSRDKVPAEPAPAAIATDLAELVSEYRPPVKE